MTNGEQLIFSANVFTASALAVFAINNNHPPTLLVVFASVCLLVGLGDQFFSRPKQGKRYYIKQEVAKEANNSLKTPSDMVSKQVYYETNVSEEGYKLLTPEQQAWFEDEPR